MRGVCLVIAAALCLALPGCSPAPATTAPALFPAERPDLAVPEPLTLPAPATLIEGRSYGVDSDISGYRFEDCEVVIAADGVEISDSEFVNCVVIVDFRRDITFEHCIFRDLSRYEETALRVNGSANVTVTACEFRDNFIGLGVQASTATITGSRFVNNNGHNALVVGEGSRATVSGNYFYGSFPHAILVLNRGGSPEAGVSITGNVIDRSAEDAINFEDYSNAAPSLVSGNVITNTGWAAVLVEYNSWRANVTIEDNWIEDTGAGWPLATHPLQPEVFQAGWGHGILIEDASQVQAINNRIVSAGEGGIAVRNGREITVEGNGIDCAGAGISALDYAGESLYREFSPLSPEDAGGSRVTARDNVIFSAAEDYADGPASELLRD